ncbi:hypothetical protein XHV734_1025 [Xanthomonas hortorum pv. vitians]|nr:hypothetical protein XHV734_1025 [Xanthomonas hortorum pv. vitians]
MSGRRAAGGACAATADSSSRTCTPGGHAARTRSAYRRSCYCSR